MANLIIIEDEDLILSFISQFLKDQGFVVESCSSGAQGVKAVIANHPDLVVLDLGLPDISGESVLKQIREFDPSLPVIILTAKADVNDIVKGFNLGADDYLTKPFAAEVLLARINARLKKTADSDTLTIGDLTVNLETYEVTRSDEPIKLTKTEFDLLVYLMRNPNRVLTKDVLLNHVWGYDSDVESRVVDVYISYLRKKIDRPHQSKLIQNQHGVGYILKTPD